jgi:hypothetical protein
MLEEAEETKYFGTERTHEDARCIQIDSGAAGRRRRDTEKLLLKFSAEHRERFEFHYANII